MSSPLCVRLWEVRLHQYYYSHITEASLPLITLRCQDSTRCLCVLVHTHDLVADLCGIADTNEYLCCDRHDFPCWAVKWCQTSSQCSVLGILWAISLFTSLSIFLCHYSASICIQLLCILKKAASSLVNIQIIVRSVVADRLVLVFQKWPFCSVWNDWKKVDQTILKAKIHWSD